MRIAKSGVHTHIVDANGEALCGIWGPFSFGVIGNVVSCQECRAEYRKAHSEGGNDFPPQRMGE